MTYGLTTVDSPIILRLTTTFVLASVFTVVLFIEEEIEVEVVEEACAVDWTLLLFIELLAFVVLVFGVFTEDLEPDPEMLSVVGLACVPSPAIGSESKG